MRFPGKEDTLPGDDRTKVGLSFQPDSQQEAGPLGPRAQDVLPAEPELPVHDD